jgi:hypothetical protein
MTDCLTTGFKATKPTSQRLRPLETCQKKSLPSKLFQVFCPSGKVTNIDAIKELQIGKWCRKNYKSTQEAASIIVTFLSKAYH